MERKTRRPRSERLARLCTKVEQWRAGRESPKSRLPERLWKQAVEVARLDGVWATSKALRFNYEDLKRRLANAPNTLPTRASTEPLANEFVEFQATAFSAHRADAKVVVELLGPRNDRMRIEAAPEALDLNALVYAFWSRQPCSS